jgi:hypothetical protein
LAIYQHITAVLNARDYDINNVKTDIRIAVEELVYIAGFDKTKDETYK